MYNQELVNELKRLDFENFLWILFAILSVMNIIGDDKEEEFLLTNESSFHDASNKIFEITLVVTLLIYIYFFIRNYQFYEKSSPENKQLYLIKLLGSSFLIAGIVCLIYFQFKQTSFVGSPAI